MIKTQGFRGVRSLLVLMTALAWFCAASGCSKDEERLKPRSLTWAELRTVKNPVRVTPPGDEERSPYPRERLADGTKIRVEAGGVAWLRRDGGATLLIRGPARLTLRAAALAVDEGRVFVDTPPGSVDELVTPSGTLTLSAVRASLSVPARGASKAYVLSGEVRAEKGRARAGEELALEAGGAVEVKPVLGWEDWTGGLATTDRAAAPAPFGVGSVGARLPGEAGAARFPLSIQRLEVRVKIDGDFALTEVDQLFFNPKSETVEGIYGFRTPEGAILQRFGVDREGMLVWGRVREKAAAAAQYQANVYRGSSEDPALLEWDAPGVYRARLYPIAPGATRRVVVRYAQWLDRTGPDGERRLYVYPMAAEGSEDSLPHIEELKVTFDLASAHARDVRVGMAGVRSGDSLIVRAHDFVPRADLALELLDEGVTAQRAYRAPHAVDLETLAPTERATAARKAEGEADYLLVPVRPSQAPLPGSGLDLAIVVDASAATDAATLSITRAATSALLAHLGEQDRALVLAGDDNLRPIVAGWTQLAKIDATLRLKVEDALSRLSRGGATDLGAMLTAAVRELDPARRSAVVYIGDAAPTVGELSLSALRERLGKLANPVRLFGLGVGDGAKLDILAGIARCGFAERIADGHQAALAALHVLEQAERPAWLGVKLDLGTGVERVFPREQTAFVSGETLWVVGRLNSGKEPERLKISGPAGQRDTPLKVERLEDHGDLRRRWAEARLAQMLEDGEGRASLVDLGMKNGIITPVTSLYVPTTNEMSGDERAELQARREKMSGAQPSRVKRPSKYEIGVLSQAFTAKSEVAAAQEQADDKEGGTGSRARGEEGSPSAATAAKTMEPAALRDLAPEDVVTEPSKPEPTTAPAPAATAIANTAAPAAEPASPQATSETLRPGAHGFASVLDTGFGGGGLAAIGTLSKEEGMKQAGGGSASASRTGLGRFGGGHAKPVDSKQQLNIHVIIGELPRHLLPCSAAASAPLQERVGLWRERLSKMAGNAEAVASVYRSALASCEAPSYRERAQLLTLMLDAMPGVTAKVSLYKVLARDLGAADVLYRGLLARIHTPEEMRELHAALGLSSVDPGILAKLVAETSDPGERARKLAALQQQFPDDLLLALELLNAYEDAGDRVALVDLARRLRERADADARVRTAVGELYLRLASQSAADDDRASLSAEGRRAFGEIVEFAPEDPVARRRLGDLLQAHGFFAEAARQFETLAGLTPDDAQVLLLRASAAEGQGHLEEALKWAEKGGAAGSPDGSSGAASTARALAATHLAWARLSAAEAGRAEELEALSARAARVLAGARQDPDKPAGVRVSLTWSHPELHPSLWTNALGTPLPAPDGDITLGISEAFVPERAGSFVEVRLEPGDVGHVARLGASAVLTVVFDELGKGEKIVKKTIHFERGGAPTQRFSLVDREVQGG